MGRNDAAMRSVARGLLKADEGSVADAMPDIRAGMTDLYEMEDEGNAALCGLAILSVLGPAAARSAGLRRTLNEDVGAHRCRPAAGRHPRQSRRHYCAIGGAHGCEHRACGNAGRLTLRAYRGVRISTTAPPSGRLPAVTVPRWASATARTIARPSPAPP